MVLIRCDDIIKILWCESCWRGWHNPEVHIVYIDLTWNGYGLNFFGTLTSITSSSLTVDNSREEATFCAESCLTRCHWCLRDKVANAAVRWNDVRKADDAGCGWLLNWMALQWLLLLQQLSHVLRGWAELTCYSRKCWWIVVMGTATAGAWDDDRGLGMMVVWRETIEQAGGCCFDRHSSQLVTLVSAAMRLMIDGY